MMADRGAPLRQRIDESCGLVVVDMQRDFMDGGVLAVPGAAGLIGPINRVVGLFGKRGAPVFYTRDWHPEDHCSFEAQGGRWPVHCVRETEGAAFAHGLTVAEEAEIVSKATERDEEAYSGFKGTHLAQALKDKGISRIFVTGVASEYCVLETVKDGIRHGFQVFVLSDCVAAVDAEAGQRALDAMRGHGARVISSADLY